jgi:putative membrane-bound dehydrogenase-like protein
MLPRMKLDHRIRAGLVAALIASAPFAPGVALSADDPRGGPLSPEEAARSFRIEPGLRLELVAAEPLIVSPVAMAFDERGRLFVAEDRGYPTGPGEGKPPVGRIALLTDSDGDGRMDRRAEFAEGLTFPNGVLPWDGGLIVTCAPEILFLRDVDGDGRADERRVLFAGFSTAGSTQLRVSHPTLSVDNWVYVTSGLTGGKVVSPSHPEVAPVELKRTDFRFRPDGSAWEAADGGAQFGLTFDDFGRRFFCYNRVQVQHAVISSATLRRNPHLAFSDTVQDCPAETVAEPLKGHGAAARLYPISRNVTTADSHAGTFTAACGVTIFRGSGLPESYRGGAFSCDPTGNLVHFDRLEPRGATFSARPPRQGVEFLASSDNWCRPVFLAQGPDGALYVCDMYRKTIEHPDYLPTEIRKQTDFDSGKDRGRIWRVASSSTPPGEARRLRQPDLSGASIETLCKTLLDRNGWHVDTAHRLLLARRDPASIGPLKALAASPSSPPTAVVHAVRVLEALKGLDGPTLNLALGHPSPPVREDALLLAEPRLAADPTWLAPVRKLADDPDARVRFRTAIALGASRPEAEGVAAALARIAAIDGADRWARAAVFSSLSGRESAFLEALRDGPRAAPSLPTELLEDLGKLVGAGRSKEDGADVFRSALGGSPGFSVAERTAFLAGFLGAIRGRLDAGKSGDVLSAAIGPVSDRPALLEFVGKLVEAAGRSAVDPARPVTERRASVALLGDSGFDRSGATLLELVDPGQPPSIEAAAVRALANQRDDRVSAALLARERFAAYTPALRDEVLSALLSRPHQLPVLLSALEDGRVPPGAIDALHRRQLAQHRDGEIRRRAEALFGTVSGDRGKVYEAYKDVVESKSDPANGRAVFRRECASCHRLDQEGFAVGPDLFGIRNQPKAAILLHSLAPDHEITPGFAAYSVATRDGRVLNGLIASETPTSLTLRQPFGKEETVLRDQVEAISTGTSSLMPQGLENNISRREFADLLAYLKGEGPAPREDSR